MGGQDAWPRHALGVFRGHSGLVKSLWKHDWRDPIQADLRHCVDGSDILRRSNLSLRPRAFLTFTTRR